VAPVVERAHAQDLGPHRDRLLARNLECELELVVGIEPRGGAETDADGAQVDDLALGRARSPPAEPDGAGVAAAAETTLTVDREHSARAQARMRPGARRFDALDAELHEGDTRRGCDAHR